MRSLNILIMGGLLSALMAVCGGRAEGGAPEPMSLPPHPRLMLTDAEIPRIKARIERTDAFRTRYAALLSAADAWTERKVEIPPRGGQWYHWYVCKKDGARLVTVSPNAHKCPVCGTVYSGWPYDDVALMRIHDDYSKAVRDLGLAHRLSGERKYADKAREILLAYAEKYPDYPLHDINGMPTGGGGKVGPQTLDEAVWLIPICQGADLIWDRLSVEDQRKIEAGLIRPAAQLIRAHEMGIHNIQCWQNSAVGLAGLLMGDRDLVADAVDSPLGFKEQIARGLNNDGQWFEGSWSYHFYAMNAMAPLAEAGERCGLNLYRYEKEGKGFRGLLEAPLNFAMPNGDLPRFNDSWPSSLSGAAGLYELGLARYGDPRFAGPLRHRMCAPTNGLIICAHQTKRDSIEALICGVWPLPAPPAAEPGSHDYTSAGYAVLRQGAGADATWLCLKYGPHGYAHGHPDKLSFVLYSRGKVLAGDPGTGQYGAPLYGDWQRTTLAHNTLTVDRANQDPATGRSLAFVTGPGFAAALADAGPIYKGLTYRRAIALIGKDVVLALDLVSAERPRSFDFALHGAGEWSAKPQGLLAPMPDKPGYRYLRNMVETAAPLPPIIVGDLKIGIAVAASKDAAVWAGTGPGDNTSERLPCAILHLDGDQAQVAWAMDLQGATPQNVHAVPTASGWAAEAEVRGRTYRLIADPEGAEKLKVEVRADN